jgi:hypothetical protein
MCKSSSLSRTGVLSTRTLHVNSILNDLDTSCSLTNWFRSCPFGIEFKADSSLIINSHTHSSMDIVRSCGKLLWRVAADMGTMAAKTSQRS